MNKKKWLGFVVFKYSHTRTHADTQPPTRTRTQLSPWTVGRFFRELRAGDPDEASDNPKSQHAKSRKQISSPKNNKTPKKIR